MDERLKNIAASLLNRWKSLDKKKKTLIIGGAAAVVLLAVILTLVFNTVTYEALYSGLSDSESGQIVSQLKTLGVSYRTSGDTILVDKNKADEVRMQLAMNGYPQSDLNYSTYQNATSWAQTDSDKQRYAIYQTQNRLQDTIKTIPEVTSVEVTIGNSDNNDYVLSSDKVPVTASVKLNLNPGASLTQKQVKGIVLLVSHSFPDLSSDNVAVIDSDGTPLTSSNNSTGDVGDQLQLKSQIESMIRQKVLEVLKPVYGTENVQVAAGATLDFSDKTTSTTTYSGTNNGQGVISNEQTSSSVTTTGGATGGTAGVNGGTPTYPSTSSGSGDLSTQQSGQTSYLVNSVNEVVQSHGGTVSKLTVAVLLNSKDKIAATAKAASVQETVAFAVGIDPKEISVQLTPFQTDQQPTTPQQTASTLFSNMYLIAGAAGLLLLIAITIIITMLIVRKSHKKAAKAAEEEVLAVAASGAGTLADPEFNLPSLEESMRNNQQNGYRKQIEELVDKKPELVAQILKNWLKD